MHRFSGQDFWAGIMFIGVAVAGFVLTRTLTVGTAGDMGPGYVPRLLSGAIGVLGVIIAARSMLRGSDPIELSQFRPVLLIASAALAFGVLLPLTGLLPAVIALVVLSALAGSEFRPVAVTMLSTLLALFCVGVFKIGVGLNFAVIRGVW